MPRSHVKNASTRPHPSTLHRSWCVLPLLLDWHLTLSAALGATITIFDLQGPDSPPLPEQNDEVTFQVLGTNSAGATTFLEQVNITAAVQTTTIDGSAVTTTVSTAFTAESAFQLLTP